MNVPINTKRPLHLFDGYGVEMEYMIVDSNSLDVLPVADKVLEKMAGSIVNEVSREGMAWSNELSLHVIEVKTDGAALSLKGLGHAFQEQLDDINTILSEMNARLMPGAMHPWMDPFSEVKLWPHEYNPIYEAYHRIFDCRGHGWSNVQSTHLNLPFHGDAEFAKLHAAIRLILPLIPALAASSPVADGEKKRMLDYRMEMYRINSLKIPSITGLIVPEPVFTKKEYEETVFKKMYADIAPFDPDNLLQEEWLNSRGAMSRWDRGAIEVRVIDVQEFPHADIAILEWIIELSKMMVNEEWQPLSEQKNWTDRELYNILMSVIVDGEKAIISDRRYLSMFGISSGSMSAGMVCREIFDRMKGRASLDAASSELLDLILREGPLARRITNALPDGFTVKELFGVYESLSECLQYGKPFVP